MSNKLPVLKVFQKPASLLGFIVAAAVLFYANIYVMSHLPGSDGFQCLIGGSVSPINIVFSSILSLMAGLLVGGLIYLSTQKATRKFSHLGSTTTFGVGLGMLTTFCTICSLPVISFLGIGIGLSFIAENELIFKGLSIAIMAIALYLLNAQLKGNCNFCKT